MGAKSEALIVRGIESLARRSGRVPIARAWPLVQQIIAVLNTRVFHAEQAVQKAIEVAVDIGAKFQPSQPGIHRRIAGVAAAAFARRKLVVGPDRCDANVLAKIARRAGPAADQSIAREVDLVKAGVAGQANASHL